MRANREIVVVVKGMAGSGKDAVAKAIGAYLREQGFPVTEVRLDDDRGQQPQALQAVAERMVVTKAGITLLTETTTRWQQASAPAEAS